MHIKIPRIVQITTGKNGKNVMIDLAVSFPSRGCWQSRQFEDWYLGVVSKRDVSPL